MGLFDFFQKKDKIELYDSEYNPEVIGRIFSAVIDENYSELSRLIKDGGDISAPNESGITPLVYATLNKKYKMVEFLLSKKANPQITDILGATPFSYAVKMGDLKLARMLLKHSSVKYEFQKDDKLIFHAINENMSEMITYLMKLGADINAVNHHSYTPLMCTIFRGNIKSAMELIQHGADVNIKSEKGKTALMYAIELGNKWLIKTIIDKGADLKAVDDGGDTIRDYVRKTDNRELLHFYDYYIKTLHRY